MTSATKLRQKQAEHYAEARKLNALATDEKTDQELVPDLIEKVDAAMKLGDDMEAECAAAEQREARMNRINELIERGNQPEVNLDGGNEAQAPRVTIPATCRRHTVRSFANREVDGMDAEHRCYAFGRFMLGVAAKMMPGNYGQHFKFARETEELFGDGTMNVATEGGNAGVWVPDQFGTDIIVLAERYGVVRNLFNVLPMFSDKRTDPKEGSDPDPTFVGEGVEGTDVTPTDDSTVTLTARKLMAILLYSSELNEDAIISFGDNMMVRMARGFAKKEDQCGLIGDGTSTYGQMKGLHTRLRDVDGAGTDSAGLITGAAGTDTAWSGFTLTDFEEAIALLPDFEDSSETGSVWLTHRTFYYQTMVRLELAQGGSTGAEMRDGFRTPLFMGWPVVFSNVMPKTAAATSMVATFGDHARAANFGDRRMYTVAFSDQATIGSVNLFSSDQVAIKATERFDIAVHSVGDSTDAGPVIGVQTSS